MQESHQAAVDRTIYETAEDIAKTIEEKGLKGPLLRSILRGTLRAMVVIGETAK